MKKENIFLLLRFVVIVLLYALWVRFCGIGTILLYYTVFIPLLALYLVVLIISMNVSERKAGIIRIVSDLIFIILFSLETIDLVYAMNDTSDVGEAIFGLVSIIIYSPMFILFIVWLIKDIINHKRMKSQNRDCQ